MNMMKAQKDPKTGKWLVQYRYTDWQGKRHKSTKRGFSSKKDAEDWLCGFLLKAQADLNMKFSDFLQIYYEDMELRLREYTMKIKRNIIDSKILPYFGEKKMADITPADIRRWQSILMKQGYAQTYLKTIHNQLAAVFHYAEKYYNLSDNPCAKAGSIGKSRSENVDFWTIQEFTCFLEAIPGSGQSYMIFLLLYWTGMRIGEILALTGSDVDLERHTISVTKSYQRLGKRDIITPPKTKKSYREIKIPEFLTQKLEQYLGYKARGDAQERLFTISRYALQNDMLEGIKKSGVKRIRIHDLRHSHASLLVEMGFSPLEISERLGHEKVETTLNIYSHLYPDKQSKLADKLEQEFWKACKNNVADEKITLSL